IGVQPEAELMPEAAEDMKEQRRPGGIGEQGLDAVGPQGDEESLRRSRRHDGSPSNRPSIPRAGAPPPARLAIPVLDFGSNGSAAFAPIQDAGVSGCGRGGTTGSPEANARTAC